MPEPVTNDRIVPVDQRREAAFTPNEPALIALFGGLEDKAQPRLIPFIFHAVEAAPLALEAGVLCEAPTDAIDRLIGASRQRLRHHRIDMLGDPTAVGRLDKLMQGIFGETIYLSQRGERLFALLLVCLLNGACLLPRRVGSHVPQSLHRLT